MAEITYQGLSRVPDDYTSADGQAALSLNLVPENGSLQPIFPPSLIFTLDPNYKVAYIHKTTAFTHYIITRADGTLGEVYWIDSKDAHGERKDFEERDPETGELYYHELDTPEGTEIKAIQAVGNTLIIVTEEAMNYYLWKTDESNSSYYQYLGTHLPELNLSFGLQGELVRDVDDLDDDTADNQKITSNGNTAYYGFEVDLAKEIDDCDWNEFKSTGKYKIDDDNKTVINERVLAQVNKFIANHSTNAGKFLFPFFVRYAYRLYDGNITMHSAPILMLANTVCSPTVFIQGYNAHGEGSSFIDDWPNNVNILYCSVNGVVHTLDYAATNTQEELNNIAETWSDIIKSVDIFISAPLYNYDEGGEVEYLQYAPYIDAYDDKYGYSLCRPSIAKERHYNTWNGHIEESTSYKWEGEETKTVEEGNEEVEKEYYCLDHYCHCPFSFLQEVSDGTPNFRVALPVKSLATIEDEVRSCCNFYLLKSIKTKDISTEATIVDVPTDYLQSLVAREQMTDDYDSHDTLLPTFLYNYNNRLDMANITKILYSGYDPMAIYCYINGAIKVDSTAQTFDSERSAVNAAIYTYIKQDSKTIIVKSPVSHLDLVWRRSASEGDALLNDHLYFYYPNTNAYKAVLVRYGEDESTGVNTTVIQEMELEPHDFLNGAVYFDDWTEPPVTSTDGSDIPEETIDQTVSVANKLYLSEINNPFFFPVEQIVTVGTGKILGIATAAKPLSQGQFGSFPLYAFCDDGVWALSVNNEGIYSAVQPITRDVCINEKAITQLDSSVLFPTARGIMQISGNAATCITDIFDSDDIYPIEKLPHYEQLLRLASSGEWCKDDEEPFSIVPITDFLATAVILYDYTNQRIYVCNDGLNYAYVLSIKSQQWGMATVDISSVVNSYPDAYAMTPDGQFVDFTHPDTSAPAPCVYVTRPLKLDGPNALKTVTAVIQRGFFDHTHVQSAIFGSRDLLHYHTIRTSQTHELRAFAGTPYKYFRVAVLAQLIYGESIFGATVNSTPRLTNKAR